MEQDKDNRYTNGHPDNLPNRLARAKAELDQLKIWFDKNVAEYDRLSNEAQTLEAAMDFICQWSTKYISKLRAQLFATEVDRDAVIAERDQAKERAEACYALSLQQQERAQRFAEERDRLAAQLQRNRQGLLNILKFRKLSSDRYGLLTREEIEGVIAEIDTALAGTPTPATFEAGYRAGLEAAAREASKCPWRNRAMIATAIRALPVPEGEKIV